MISGQYVYCINDFNFIKKKKEIVFFLGGEKKGGRRKSWWLGAAQPNWA